MVKERPPLLVRPLHAWFRLCDDLYAPLSRVIAVGVAAALSAVVVVSVTRSWWIAVPVAVVAWIGLAVVQEHDDRVQIPPDKAFVDRLTTMAGPTLAAAGFDDGQAWGPHRASGGTTDTVAYARHEGWLWIRRDVAEGWMEAEFETGDVDDALRRLGYDDLAERVTRVVASESDADALAAAFTLVFAA